MRVVIAGSSGLIGTALVSHLREAGHDVLRLVRRAPAAPDERGWDPPAGRVDDGTFDGVDAVVNLCGNPQAPRPWTGAYKQAMRDSRLVPTEVLAAAVAEHRVPTLVNASGINYYGDTGPDAVDEKGPAGTTGFLTVLSRDWEAATAPAAAGGARVVPMRTGLVLSPSGGLLGTLRPLFRMGLGGRLGSGRQYMSCISLDDHVGAIRYVVEHDAITGPVNSTGPQAVTNAEFTSTFAAVLGRPAVFAVPSFGIRLVLGEAGEELALTSIRVVPAVLEGAGYQYRHRTVREMLAAAVGS
ncbi:TIGR01777 family oxidoreductase [Pseudonocardia sp.]|uniref:TIGR01777 family oxidoreductase n=1 Tax=Pseudonocardia sp. TaxID=60912 RepID=UPI0026312142|nr:TIGR01777 family oxidoreductase [Pseudonocardia sp.]